ncbi:MAG: hypothetical protein HYS58_03845 [Elusimicrobia bacterium]|nr:hypothetical protein [Elusimicrobiota bacterium]MBI4217873.1 hypothetical protein [Elusimicrobiota bacterium]
MNTVKSIDRLFIKYRKGLWDELLLAHAHFTLWKGLKKSIAQYKRELNNVRSFIALTFYAHGTTAVHSILKVTDNNKKSLTIHKFLDFLESNFNIFDIENYAQRILNRDHKREMVKRYAPPQKSSIQKFRQELTGLAPMTYPHYILTEFLQRKNMRNQ